MDLSNWYKIIVFSLVFNIGWTQSSQVRCIDSKFDNEVEKYVSNEVPLISVADAYPNRDKYVFLDAREKEEYKVSHIQSAVHIGYDDFDINTVSHLPKDSPIVVYCSIGYRSDIIGKQLMEAGFLNVHNLYGSIFEWVNQQHPIYNEQNDQTLKLHTYNSKWGRWVNNDSIEKIH